MLEMGQNIHIWLWSGLWGLPAPFPLTVSLTVERPYFNIYLLQTSFFAKLFIAIFTIQPYCDRERESIYCLSKNLVYGIYRAYQKSRTYAFRGNNSE